MPTPDAYLKGLSALVTAAFALVILAPRSRRSAPNLWLGVFLLLIAGNQGAEMMRALAPGEAARLVWYRCATVFAALDPAALYMFAAAHRMGPRLTRSAAMAAALVPAAILALYAGWALDSTVYTTAARGYNVALGVYTAAIYAAVLAWAVRVLAVERRQGDAWPWMIPALAIVTLLAFARITEHTVTFFYATRSYAVTAESAYLLGFVAALLLTGALFAALLRASPRLHERGRRVVLRSALLALVVVVILYANYYVWRLPVGLAPDDPPLLAVGRIGAPVRWLLFGAFVSIAALRHDALGLDVAARRRAARVLIGLTLAVVGALPLLLLADSENGGLPAWVFLLMGGMFVLSQGFRALVDRVAHRAYGVPMPGDAVGRHDAYRAAVAEALSQGRAPMRDAQLARLREDLGIDEVTAGVLEQVADASNTAPLAPGQVVGRRYHVQRLLGRGGSGRAFLARDLLLARDVAVKEVFHDTVDSSTVMLEEARIAGAIEHPHVVRVYDVIPRPGASLIVQEHVPGGTLDERLRAHGPLPLADALDLAERLLEGLAAVHSRGIVHRDLKPANVLLDAGGLPKIADFGIAEPERGHTVPAAGAPFTRAYVQGAGTPGYAAPEQVRGEPATPATDVYAAARVLAACIAAPVPPAIQQVIALAGAADPRARPVDAAAFLGAVRDARASLDPALQRSRRSGG